MRANTDNLLWELPFHNTRGENAPTDLIVSIHSGDSIKIDQLSFEC